MWFIYLSFIFLFSSNSVEGKLLCGAAQTEITPPIGTPSAGYINRKGKGMNGVHDPLFASALYIENGEKKIVFCSVDHLGFDFQMVREIKDELNELEDCHLFVSSTHTHSGGGAFLATPGVGKMLAGTFDPKIRKFYIQNTSRAILEAKRNAEPAKIGFGFSQLKELSHYRGEWPQKAVPPSQLFVIKVTSLDDHPISLLFNYALHPTTLKGDNFHFSADFIGETRSMLTKTIGNSVVSLFVNGAQAELIPRYKQENSDWDLCREVGHTLASATKKLWDKIKTKNSLVIKTRSIPYTFEVLPDPFGSKIPLKNYESEINSICFDERILILTVPGELSTVYDRKLNNLAMKNNLASLALFGLTNDAHGYIITPQAWDHQTKESQLSFGGREYGERVFQMLKSLLE